MPLKTLSDIHQLPDYQTLYQRMQVLATLEAIICEWQRMRYFKFKPHKDTSQAISSMSDGKGSHYFILFDENKNVIGKIFDNDIGHRTILEVKQIAEFEYFLSEPAFMNDEATWYFYRSSESKQWYVFPQENQVSFLALLTDPMIYVAWLKEYVKFEVNNNVVKKIVDFTPLTKDMVLTLNPNRNFDTLQEDLQDIGYPYDF